MTDHGTGRMVWAAPGKNADTARKFFDELGPERAAKLQVVTLDMRGTLQAVDALIVWDAPIEQGAGERARIDVLVRSLVNGVQTGRSELPSAPRRGFHSITPRIVVADAAAQIAFLRTVFDATGEQHPGRPAEMRIGDSVVMVTPAEAREPFAAFLYVYVDDADAVYRRALAAGAVSIEEPVDTPYGDRRAMVGDPFGNVWQIAHVIDGR